MHPYGKPLRIVQQRDAFVFVVSDQVCFWVFFALRRLGRRLRMVRLGSGGIGWQRRLVLFSSKRTRLIGLGRSLL
jgi:hypothetical protein